MLRFCWVALACAGATRMSTSDDWYAISFLLTEPSEITSNT
jgi:hypothetical protein